MTRCARLIVAFGLISVLAGVGAIKATPTSAGTGCQVGARSTVEELGTTVPVVLVHGYSSDGQQWTSGSGRALWQKVRSLGGVTPAVFDYGDWNRKWVTNENLGPKLGRAIDCLASMSKREGGRGKVILVAYSMGGLVARYAATESTIRDRGLLGLVVTIGTPHNGTPTASYLAPGDAAARGMSDGSAAQLPTFENWNVPAFYVGGDLEANIFGVRVQLGGDGAVGIDSAIPRRPLTKPGAGSWVCVGVGCDHKQILRHSEVQARVVSAIRDWIRANPRPRRNAPVTTTTVAPTTTTRPTARPSLDFTPFAGEWIAHTGRLTVRADGTGFLEYETYFDGQARVTFRLTNFSQGTVEGHVETSNELSTYPVGSYFEIEYLEGGVVEVSPVGRIGSFCHPDAYVESVCGA